MTPQQKLQYIITKAIEGGWEPFWGVGGKWYSQEYSFEEIIFNQEFAKAL